MMITIGHANRLSKDIVSDDLNIHIKKYCKKYSGRIVAASKFKPLMKITIEPALIKSIIMQECDRKPYSVRYERHLLTNKGYLNNIPRKYRNNKLSYCSLGGGQVLYGTAYWLGFRQSPEKLLLNEYSVKYCVLYIRYLIGRYWKLESVISSYNQGSPRRDVKTNHFKNQQYVNGVIGYYQKYGGKIKAIVK